MNPDAPELEGIYPGVKWAYDFVLPSYQWMTTRIEAAVTRIQALMTFTATITLGFPVLGRAIHEHLPFDSVPFLVAVLCFLVVMVVGIIARDFGETWLISPEKLYEAGSLRLSEWQFKRDAIHFAGQCFSHNAAVADRKAVLGRIMSYVLAIEILSLLVWVGMGDRLTVSVLWSWVARQLLCWLPLRMPL